MADVSIGTARGVVRIDYESRGASRVTREFEQIKSQTESTASSFATWANKIGMGNTELQRLNQIQRSVVEAQKTANYFALQYDNTQRLGTAGLSERLKMMKLVNQSQKSLGDISKVAAEAQRRLPTEMARAGSLSAKSFSEAFQVNAISGISQRASGIGSSLAPILAFGIKSAMGVALAGATAGIAGLGLALTGGFSRLTGIDTATYKLQALGMSAQKVTSIVDTTKKAVEGTQYSLDQAINVAAGAVQAGVKPNDDLLQYLKDVQGLAAVTGMDLQRVGQIMNRVQVNQTVSGADLSELEYVGVNIMPMLQKEYGKTAAEMARMRENSEISAEKFRSAISKNFGEAGEIMGNSITSAIGNMRTAISKVGAGLLAPLFAQTGADGQGPTAIASIIQGIKSAAESLTEWMGNNKELIIDFWRIIGKAGLMTAAVITGAVATMIGSFAYLVKGLSWIPRAFANIADALGADGVAEKAYKAANAMTGFGDNVLNVAKNVGGFIGTLQKGIDGLEGWSDAAKKAKEKPFSEIEAEVPKLITVTEALGKLGITSEQTSTAIQGSEEDWAKFLKTLKDKSAPQSVIDALKNLRGNFENGGRAAINYAKALKQMGDSSIDASTKANALIKSLQDLKRLPGEAEDVLASYNQTLRETTAFNNGLVDITEITGNALVGLDGKINSATKNGGTLAAKVKEIQAQTYELAATGEYAPGEIWDQSRKALLDLASQFGISQDQADKFINTYLLPKKEFEIQFLAKGKEDVQNDLTSVRSLLEEAKRNGNNRFQVNVTSDPNQFKQIIESLGLKWNQYDEFTKNAIIEVPPGTNIDETRKKIEDLFNAKPSELESQIKVLTTAEEIVNQINDGNPLKIPAVLEFSTPPLGPDGKPLVPTQLPAPVNPPGSPVPQPNRDTGGLITPQGTINPNVAPMPGGNQNPVTSTDIPEIAPLDTGSIGNFLNKEKEEAFRNLLAPNPILQQGAEQQGMNFGQAFAQGIRESIPDVLRASLEMATASTDPLGHSPAKIGPLSGSGWTYFRGRTYSEAYAEGIASGQQAVGGAALSVASASATPLSDSFSKLMQDANEWSSFGKRVFDLAASLTDISFNVLNLGQQMSNGQLFPKTYMKDPNAKKQGSRINGFNPTSISKSTEPEVYSPPSVPTGSVKPSGSFKMVQSPSPNQGSRGGVKPDKIVLHTQEGNSGASDLANDMVTNGKGLSYHYIVDKDGNLVIEAVDPKNNAFSVGKANNETINIAMAGTRAGDGPAGKAFTRDDWLKRSAQIKTTAELAAQQGLSNGIPIDKIVGHNWISNNIGGTDHFDPGPNFPWDVFSEYVTEFYNQGQKPSGTSNLVKPGSIKAERPSRASNFGGKGETYTKAWAQSKGIEPLYEPGEYAYGEKGLPPWAYEFAKQFGLDASSSVSASGEKTLHGAGLAFDFSGPQENMTKMAEYISQNMAEQTLQLIYEDSLSGKQFGIAGGQNVGSEYYSGDTFPAHRNHVHWATDVPVGGGYAPLTPAQRSSKQEPVPVTLGPNSIDAQANSAPQQPLPDPMNPLGLPQSLLDLSKNDPELQKALSITKGLAGGKTSDEDAISSLQKIDRSISEQSQMNTDVSKENVKLLGNARDSIMSSFGLQEGMNPLEMAQTLTSQVSGIVGDVFGIIDSSLKSIESTKEIGDTMVRGIADSEDIYKIVEEVQSFIDLGKNIAATTSDALGLAGTITGMAGSGDSSGGTMAAAAALGAASSIAGIISQAWAAVNATIDLGQEVYRMGTKQLGRQMLNWVGLPNASDINYLLDEMNGQLQVYSSENPMMKSSFNTLERLANSPTIKGREAPTNNLYVYQGPGQDPRDTMNDAMFAIRSSGVGAFGYAT